MKSADRVFLNGTVYTVDASFSTAQAVAVRDKRIIYVGSNDGAAALIGPDTVVTDLHGKTMLPGFIEGHIHLLMYGDSLKRLPIRDKSKEQILQMVAEAAQTAPQGRWILGGMGWNNEVWEDPSYPTKEELDAVSYGHPVLLPRMDGHMIWANSLVFQLAGITDETPNPSGGEFMRKKDGSLLGCAGNAAKNILQNVVPAADKESRMEAIQAAHAALTSYGVTSLNEAHTEFDVIGDIQELIQSGDFRIRFNGALAGAIGKNADPRERAYFLENCPVVGAYDQHFSIAAIKTLADGSVGAQSAALLQPYTDRPDHTGTLMHTDEEFYELVAEAAAHKMQMITHAIGDRAIDQTLRIYKKVLDGLPDGRERRFRIEHFQTVTGDSRERAKELGVVASMQPLHGPNSASMALRRLGPDRAPRAYAIGMVLDVLGMFAGGSDGPVAVPNPIAGIHAAVTRTNLQREPAGGFCMENAVTREQALKAYTIWGAYAQFCEAEKGSIEAGKLADFVVLEKDILSCPTEEILDTKVLLTVIDGKTVYERV